MIKVENILVTLYGLATVLVFLIMVFVSGLFNSVYTFLFRELSFFISPYSLTENFALPMFRIYNTMLLLFSLLLLLRLQNVLAKLGSLYLSMSAVMSLYLISFPMDAIRLNHSLSGTTHIVISIIVALYGIIAMQLFGFGLKRSKNLDVLSRYSFFVSIIFLITGFLTSISALIELQHYVGFIQKIPIIAFLIWIVLTAVMMLGSDKRVHYLPKKSPERRK